MACLAHVSFALVSDVWGCVHNVEELLGKCDLPFVDELHDGCGPVRTETSCLWSRENGLSRCNSDCRSQAETRTDCTNCYKIRLLAHWYWVSRLQIDWMSNVSFSSVSILFFVWMFTQIANSLVAACSAGHSLNIDKIRLQLAFIRNPQSLSRRATYRLLMCMKVVKKVETHVHGTGAQCHICITRGCSFLNVPQFQQHNQRMHHYSRKSDVNLVEKVASIPWTIIYHRWTLQVFWSPLANNIKTRTTTCKWRG